MEAPKIIWAKGTYIDPEFTRWHISKWIGGDKYIRADAPELVALVEALRYYKERCNTGMPPVSNKATDALAAWEALTNE